MKQVAKQYDVVAGDQEKDFVRVFDHVNKVLFVDSAAIQVSNVEH